MKCCDARKFINNITNIIQMAFRLVIIHGYNHGTAIKEMLAQNFSNDYIYKQFPDPRNQGVNHMLIAAYRKESINMTRTTKTTTDTKEKIKMSKYIVEAPEPKKGQKVSSGGIRENGKLTTQFKNPVPYKEPTLTPNVDLVRKEQARTRRNEVGRYLLGIAWQELGEPLLRSDLHKLRDAIINKIESPARQSMQHIPSTDSEVIDVEADEIETRVW